MPNAKYTKGKDGLFRTAVRTGKWDSNGKPITVRLSSSKSSADLERKVREVKYELEHGREQVTSSVLFGEYADRWLQTKQTRSVRTLEMYRHILYNRCPLLKDTPLDFIKKSDIQFQIDAYSKYPRICEQLAMTLKQVFEMAVDEELLTKNPCKNIVLPRHVKQEKRALTEEEKSIIRNASGLTQLETVFVHLLYGTGMRPAEMYALTWSDIDFNAHTIRISKALQFTDSKVASVGLPKTDKGIRTIPLPSFVERDLKAFKPKGKQSSTYTIVGGLKGELRTRSGYLNVFERAMKKLGLKDVTQYMLRHTFCTMCYESGIDLKTCQYLMGHSTTKMVLDVYTHADKSDLNEKILKIDF